MRSASLSLTRALAAFVAAAALGPAVAAAVANPQILAEWPVTGPAVPRGVALYCRADAGVRADLAARADETFPGGTGALRIAILAGPGGQATDAQLSCTTDVALGRGGRYEVAFWVRASTEALLPAAVRLDEAPWTLLAPGSEAALRAGPEWQRCVIPFAPVDDRPASTEVRCPGLFLGALPAGTVLWLAGVRLAEVEPPPLAPAPELLRNPGFEEGLAGWTAQASELALAPGLGGGGSTACLVRRRTARWGSPAQDVREALLANGMRVYDLRAAVRRVSGRGEAFLVLHLNHARGDRWVVSPHRGTGPDGYARLSGRLAIAWVGDLRAADLSVQTTGDDTTDLLVDDVSLRALPGELPQGGAVPPPPADPARRGAKTLVGAIRWDGWCGDLHPVGTELERVMAAETYRHRLPFYAEVPEPGRVETRGTTQQVMDRELAFAQEAGLDYWAFDWYPQGSGLARARDLYLASTRRGSVRWCAILATNPFSDAERAWLLEQFRTPHYQCVLGDRPLVYVFDASAHHADLVRRLREDTARAGAPSPFIVFMGWSAAVADAADACGADALGAYVNPLANRSTFAANMAHERRQWQALQATGVQMVPTVTTGWDPRPFLDCPVRWYPGASESNWVEMATLAQIAEQLREAIAFAAAHPEATLANTVLVYAWNENAEGGWIVPTRQELRENRYPLRLDAIRGVLRPDVPAGTGWEALCR